MFEAVVVGSGLAGAAAALELAERGVRPLLLDVGKRPTSRPEIKENLYDYRKRHDIYDLVIGERHQGLTALLEDRDIMVKLTAPHAEYVTEDADTLGPIDHSAFDPVQSFALGGLANVWGAGCYRFTNEDLIDFPVSQSELDPYFDKLTTEVGISGCEDDLLPFFGSVDGLLPPLPLGRNVGAFYRRYRNMRRRPADIHIGRARVGLLTVPYGGRPEHEYRSLEFFQEERSLYTPRFTIDRLIAEDRVELRSSLLVKRWREDEDGIEVEAADVAGGELRTFRTRRLLLAAGAINTSKIVLASFEDTETRLRLQENPAFQFPLVTPGAIGRSLEKDAFGLVQLNLVWDSPTYETRLQGSIMEITAPSRAEFFGSFPFDARSNITLIRRMLPAMFVMQLFFPGSAQEPAQLSLQRNGSLRIAGAPNRIDKRGLNPLLKLLLRLRAFTLPSMVVRVPTGHAIHYAATLPMAQSPSRYQCWPDGRLEGTRNVYVADSAAFTSLPAKNMSFAMMANAMRVAANASAKVRT